MLPQQSKRRLPKQIAIAGRGILKVEDPSEMDVIIPIMGITGAGKSRFINCAINKQVAEVGHDLNSCTSNIRHYIFPDKTNRHRRIILVDTLGFDDTYVDDTEILKHISLWLACSYGEGMKLAGIVYLHDISENRMFGTSRKNLDMFRKLCGDDALKNVILATTKWAGVSPELGARREKQLADMYWNEMIDHGSTVVRFNDSHPSACDIIDNIVLEHEAMDFMRIQEELVNIRKTIPQTDAGQALRAILQTQLQQQQETAREMRRDKQARGRDEGFQRQWEEARTDIRSTLDQIRALRVPLSVRIKTFFGLS